MAYHVPLTDDDNARLEATLVDLRHEFQMGQRDALDAYMILCRNRLAQWAQEAARQKAQERDNLARERTAMLQEVEALRAGVDADRTAFEARMTALQGQAAAQESRVLLDVGDMRFTTSVATLRTVPSYFDGMFGGQFSAAGQDGLDSYEDEETGELVYFIDRDGYAFRHILEFLRDGGKSLARLEDLVAGGWKGAWKLRGLKREFGYFLIDVDQAVEAEAAKTGGAVVQGGATLAVGGKNNGGEIQAAVWRYDSAGDVWVWSLSSCSPVVTVQHCNPVTHPRRVAWQFRCWWPSRALEHRVMELNRHTHSPRCAFFSDLVWVPP